MMQNSERQFIFIGMLALLLIPYFLFLQPRQESQVPLHSDEYDNIAVAQRSMSEGKIFQGDPYAPAEGSGSIYNPKNQGYDPEAGYAALLLLFSLSSGFSPLALANFLPWLFSIIFFLASFILLKKILSGQFLPFCAAMFVFFLPSSSQMLGPMFLAASSLSLALLPALIILGRPFLIERKNTAAFLLLMAASAAIYPPVAAAMAIALLSSIILSPRIIRHNLRFLLFSLILIILLFMAAYSIYLYISGFNPIALSLQYGSEFVFAFFDYLFDQVLFRASNIGAIPFAPEYLGLVLFAFCALGTIFLAAKKISRKPENGEIIFAPAIMFMLLWLIGIYSGRGFFIPAERLALYSAYFLLLCGGIFFALAIRKIADSLESKGLLQGSKSALAPIIFLILLCSAIIYSHPFRQESLQLNTVPVEMDGFSWIEKNSPENSLILATPYLSKPLYVFTGRQVFCTTPTRFGCPQELNNLAAAFFFANCRDKEKILSEYFPADYIFVQKQLIMGEKAVTFPNQDCNFLEKTFDGENIIIYKSKDYNKAGQRG